ncbi:MAG: nucleotidyltransferase family protein [Acidimicrobiales bacterium]
MNRVVGIVLGAGSSTRLGRPKQTLAFGPRTLLAHVVDQVERSSLDRVVVVLGGGADEAEASLGVGRAEVVHNDGYGSGCASSLLAGLDAAGDADAVVMLLGDMPGVTAAVIDEALARWCDRPTWAAVTSYTDRLGHPLVFSAAAFAELRALHGDKAVWKVVDREPEERVGRLVIDQPCPLDVDTWDDYLAVCAAFGVDPGAPRRDEPA